MTSSSSAQSLLRCSPRQLLRVALASTALVVGLAFAPPAKAGFEACGDIQVEANAKCEVYVGLDCHSRCEPVNFELACAAQLQAQCSGSCDAEITQTCQETCTDVCLPDCTVDPGKFACQGQCEASCGGQCESHCAANSNQAHCEASCQAECSAQCSGSCDVQLPTATCDQKCSEVCGASCEAQANIKCQVDCQASAFAQCESKLSGGCEVQCEQPEGALFCNGQFIDHGGNLNACVDALNDYLAAHVQVHGDADAECDDSGCHAEAEGGIACNCTSSSSPAASWGFWCGLLGLTTFWYAAQRRRTAVNR